MSTQNDLNAAVPSAFRLLFPRSVVNTPTPDFFEIVVTLTSLNLPEFGGAVGNGTTETVRMASRARFSNPSATTPTNFTVLNNLAQQWSRDEYRLRLGRLSARLVGTVPAAPDALHDLLEWHHLPDALDVLADPGPPKELDVPTILSSAGGPTSDGVWCQVTSVKSICLLYEDSQDPTKVTGLVLKNQTGIYWMQTCPTEEDITCSVPELDCCDGETTPPPPPYPPPPPPYCPPAQNCSTCSPPEDTPSQWVVEAHGFGGPCAIFNGTWVLEQVSGCLWQQRRQDGSLMQLLITGSNITIKLRAIIDGDIGVAAVYVTNSFNSDCCSNVTVPRQTTACATSPSHLSAVPICCDESTPNPIWWCVNLGNGQSTCVASATEPANVIAGPYASQSECQAADCGQPLYWCVSDGGNPTCVRSATVPSGLLSGPYVSAEACAAACVETFWWCVNNSTCVEAAEAPVGTTSGPFASQGECEASCDIPVISDPCCGCDESPENWLLTVAGITNGTCGVCTNYNGAFTLGYHAIITCAWQDLVASVRCPAEEPEGGPLWLLECLPDDSVWRLTSLRDALGGTYPVYEKSMASWNCLGTNILTKVGGDGTACANWPATVSVSPIV